MIHYNPAGSQLYAEVDKKKNKKDKDIPTEGAIEAGIILEYVITFILYMCLYHVQKHCII